LKKKVPSKSPRKASVSEESWRILIANGVNLDLLGRRESEHYGCESLPAIEKRIVEYAQQLQQIWPQAHFDMSFYQSNDEGAFLAQLDQGWDGVVINPGAWSHTSLALADRLVALRVPFVEVHLSNLARREKFRQKSYAAPHACGVVYGFGSDSYLTGLTGLLLHLHKESKAWTSRQS